MISKINAKLNLNNMQVTKSQRQTRRKVQNHQKITTSFQSVA